MKYLQIFLYAYLIVGCFYSLLTIFMIFKSKDSKTHKQTLKSKWNSIWNTPGIGKIIAIITIIVALIWLIIGWPDGLIKGFRRLKNTNNES